MSEKEKTSSKQFREIAGSAGLKKATIDKLLAEDFHCTDVVKLMSSDDIAALEISMGQTRTLERRVLTLNHTADTTRVASPAAGPAPTSDVPTSDQPAPADTPGDLTFAELWNSEGDNTATNGRPFLIHDFISRVHYEESERAVCSQGSTQLILRSSRQKPAPEAVTLPQWISANARIMAKMISDGVLKSNQDVLDYLEYVMDFGDYAQVNEIESVMLYDHEYRKKQSRKRSKWGSDDIHLANFYLQRKNLFQRPRQNTNRRHAYWILVVSRFAVIITAVVVSDHRAISPTRV